LEKYTKQITTVLTYLHEFPEAKEEESTLKLFEDAQQKIQVQILNALFFYEDMDKSEILKTDNKIVSLFQKFAKEVDEDDNCKACQENQ
jgi:hypothetical protein